MGPTCGSQGPGVGRFSRWGVEVGSIPVIVCKPFSFRGRTATVGERLEVTALEYVLAFRANTVQLRAAGDTAATETADMCVGGDAPKRRGRYRRRDLRADA